MPDGICGVKTRNALNNTSHDSWEEIKHFKPEEFTCKCGCGYNPIILRLVKVLEQIRAHFGDKITIITSGCRCSTHNKKVGGVQGSKHVLGAAADFYIQGIPTSILLAYCQSLVNAGIIGYTYTNESNMRGVVHINL